MLRVYLWNWSRMDVFGGGESGQVSLVPVHRGGSLFDMDAPLD